jgi:rare lipoprotein A
MLRLSQFGGEPLSYRVVGVAVMIAAVGLSACGTTKTASLPPPDASRIPGPGTIPVPMVPAIVVPRPVYKVGNPYQVDGMWYYPREQPGYDETGIASWYGSMYHGMLTADGEVFDLNAVTGAHPTLPLPANVRVTNLENGRSIIVRVNDRGPFVNGRILDLSEHAADLLGFKDRGTARVRVTLMGRADLYGPGLAPPTQETPPEVALAVPAAPTAQVTTSELPPLAGTRVAPPIMAASLPKPLQQDVATVKAELPDGKVTVVAVPATTAIYVQAGAFTSPTNAGQVAAQLAGLGARVSPALKDGKRLYRVRIGPFQAVGEADAAMARVHALGHNDVEIVVDSASS